jgi:hypothetical protein
MPLNPRKLAAPQPWDGDWSKLPGTLTARHMASILGVTVDTVWDQIQERRIVVSPISWVPRYRWLRDVVRRQLEG